MQYRGYRQTRIYPLCSLVRIDARSANVIVMVLLSLLSLGRSPRTRWITTVLPPLVNFMFIRLGPGSGTIIRNSLRRTGFKNGEPLAEALSEIARAKRPSGQMQPGQERQFKCRGLFAPNLVTFDQSSGQRGADTRSECATVRNPKEKTMAEIMWTVKDLSEALKRFLPEAKVYYEMGPNGAGTIGRA